MSNPMINPMAPINTEADARAAARASAVAIFIGVLYGLFGLVFGMDAMRAGVDAQMASSPQAGMTSETLVNIAVGMAVFFIVVQLVLGWVQWAKPNVVIPIIFAILVAWGLVSVILVKAGAFPGAETPLWMTVLAVVVMVVELVLHITGVRGASKLDKLRKAGPVNEDDFL
jgi:hypothetical protein